MNCADAADLRTTTQAVTDDPDQDGVDVLLADGSIARVRPLRRSDDQALRELRDGLDAYVDRILAVAPEKLVALVAESGGRVIAVASAERTTPDSASITCVVAERALGHGVATLLLEHLAARARRAGVRRFLATAREDNHGMLQVLRDAGFDLLVEQTGGEVSLEMSTLATDRAIEAADLRECAAEARSLAALWDPAGVAVVGVSRSARGVGRAVLDSIRENGYGGRLSVVHPDADEIDGVPAYPSLGAVPHRVDVVIIAVPADRVRAVVDDAGRARIPCAVIITSGFAEKGESGHAAQRELVRVARSYGMRLIGPNCFGVASYSPDVRFNATFATRSSLPGGLAVASQSGGVGIALLDAARRSGLGLASFVSLGNKSDVSGNDLLAAWMLDDRVKAAALYLESFGNPRKFARFARRFSERRPLVCVVGGRSAEGARAGASHTAAATTPIVAVEAVFAQAGVIEVESVDELVDVCTLLVSGPLPEGRRVGIVTNVGGIGVLTADAAHTEGLSVPALSAETRELLVERVGGAPGTSNPIDLGAAASPASFRESIRTVLGSGEVDSLLVGFAATRVGDTDGVLAAIREAVADATVPVALVVLGTDAPVPGPGDGGPTVFRSAEAALHALAKAARYAAWRATPRGAPVVAGPEPAEVRSFAAALLRESRPHRGWLGAAQIRDLLGRYGVDAPVGAVAVDPGEAATAARRIGFPVVAKVADPDVLHKTDRKLVAAGLTTAGEVAEAVESFRRELGRTDVPVLVQPFVTGGVELALGISRDPTFGPVVMVATGGIATEVWRDRVFLVPPVTRQDAARAVKALRIAPLLEGFRGAEPCDVEAFHDLVVAVAHLAEDVPALSEMDLNPVIVTPSGAACVDVRIRLTDPGAGADGVPGVPRALRTPV